MKISLIELGVHDSSQTKSDTVQQMIRTAQAIESYGFHRIWLAEHHNAPYLMNRAPEVMIPLIASQTSTIRVGSGSVLLNHYSPFKVATNFSMLADMFPNRIDMGIGRATTGSPYADFALQRNRSFRQMTDDSEEQLVELLHWMHGDFPTDHPFYTVQLHHDGNYPDFWLLGSSPWSAEAAARLGLQYAFAGFINPYHAFDITQHYHQEFQPTSVALCRSKPKLMMALSIYCAETMEAAGRLAAPHVYMMKQLIQGNPNTGIITQEAAIAKLGYIPAGRVTDTIRPPHYIIGTPETIAEEIRAIAATFHTEEIMVQCISTNEQLRLQSLQLLAKCLL